MTSVGKAAADMVSEIRRQFREIPAFLKVKAAQIRLLVLPFQQKLRYER